MLILKQLVCRARERYFHVPVQVSVNLVNSELLGVSALLHRQCRALGDTRGDGCVVLSCRGRLQDCSAVLVCVASLSTGHRQEASPSPASPGAVWVLTSASFCDLVGQRQLGDRIMG